MLSPQQVADKWAAKASAAGTDYKNGIAGVTVAPGQLAVQAQDVMVQRWQEAISSGRWAQRTGNVSLQSWQAAAMNKGAANYGTGISAGKPKMAAFLQAFLPVAAQVKEAVRSIPRDGGAGSLARVQLAMQAFQAFRNARR
jgi:hypothetical protein